ncbi:MAG: phospholipase A [Gallionella sp.]
MKYFAAGKVSSMVLFTVFAAVFSVPARAGANAAAQCARDYFQDSATRLDCYDHAYLSVTEAANSAAEPSPATPPADRSYLTRVWNLDDLSNLDPSKLGRLHPYRLNYLLISRTSSANRQPSSPLADHVSAAPGDIDAQEAKFQLSVKADIGDKRNINFPGIKTLRFWGAYTQQSNWQIFNTRNSTPFRETVYEPELIATLGTGSSSGLKLINLGWLHQSNGKPLPESRSWNRIYLLGGWEWNDMTSITVRAWQRIPEVSTQDDNPDIVDYLGRGDFFIRWEPRDKSQAVGLLLRNNLRKSANRGFLQLDWATPVRFGNSARMHLQLTSGYGASMIDYNHHQNTIGLGFSFREW